MPKSQASWLKWLLLIALLVALALGVARALNKRKTQQAAAKAAALALQEAAVFQLAATDVVLVQNTTLTQVTPVSGSLKAVQTALVKAKVPGEIAGLQKREGEAVKAGEVLARIDSADAQSRVRQAEQQAQATQAQSTIARRAQENNQSLVKQGFISPTALDTSTANLNAAQANHQAALAALDIARKAVGDTALRSPISGLVSARYVQNGERVGMDARVFEVVDLSTFELEAALAPVDAASVASGQTAQLLIEGIPTPIKATVARINPSVQAGSRSVLIYLSVPAVPGMRQGLFAKGEISTSELQGLAVPLSTLRNDKPQPYVQVVQANKIVHVPVRLDRQGMKNGNPMVIVDGAAGALSQGAAVLRAQAGLIREGTVVQLDGASIAPQASN